MLGTVIQSSSRHWVSQHDSVPLEHLYVAVSWAPRCPGQEAGVFLGIFSFLILHVRPRVPVPCPAQCLLVPTLARSGPHSCPLWSVWAPPTAGFLKRECEYGWISLVVQWLGIRLPVQGTRVRSLSWEDATCRGATKPVYHNH